MLVRAEKKITRLTFGDSLSNFDKITPFLNFYFISNLPAKSLHSDVPLKTNFENLVCKISQNVFELEPSYLVCWLGLRRRSPD